MYHENGGVKIDGGCVPYGGYSNLVGWAPFCKGFEWGWGFGVLENACIKPYDLESFFLHVYPLDNNK